jgi:hypothetical protein
MRIVFTKFDNDNTGAVYNSQERAIKVNVPCYKRYYPKSWRRMIVAAITHELTHAIMNKINHYEDNDIYAVYKEELICYRVQRVFEYLLTGQFQWAHTGGIEQGAIMSTASIIKFYCGSGNLC